MAKIQPIEARGYYFTGQSVKLEPRNFAIDNVNDQEVVIAVSGCGLCHTDLGFLREGIKTKKEPPLILGHEISGRVVATGAASRSWQGKAVIVPAVLPCGECELCRAGRDNICPKQIMPGNDIDGGFASHVVVPSRFLCPLPDDTKGIPLSHFSVIADAVTTPYQSLQRSGLKKDELAVVIGAGGIGSYMIQHARNVGARVVAIDIDDKKPERALRSGANLSINSKNLTEKEIKEKIKIWTKQEKVASFGWKIFEMSGSAPGQGLAFALLGFAGTLGIVGFTMEKVTIRLSNIMAYDGDIFGNWGCSPKYYPAVAQDILNGRIQIKENVETFSLSQINEVIQMAIEHKLERRAVLIPEGGV